MEILLTTFIVIVTSTLGYIVGDYVLDYNLSPKNWHCTQSHVIDDSLPRKEECIQYTKDIQK